MFNWGKCYRLLVAQQTKCFWFIAISLLSSFELKLQRMFKLRTYWRSLLWHVLFSYTSSTFPPPRPNVKTFLQYFDCFCVVQLSFFEPQIAPVLDENENGDQKGFKEYSDRRPNWKKKKIKNRFDGTVCCDRVNGISTCCFCIMLRVNIVVM